MFCYPYTRVKDSLPRNATHIITRKSGMFSVNPWEKEMLGAITFQGELNQNKSAFLRKWY